MLYNQAKIHINHSSKLAESTWSKMTGKIRSLHLPNITKDWFTNLQRSSCCCCQLNQKLRKKKEKQLQGSCRFWGEEKQQLLSPRK